MQMNILLSTSIVACATLILTLLVLIRRIGFAGRDLPVTAEWIDELSIERYRPMARLLLSSDIEFLRSQPACSSKTVRHFRRQRCQIFRAYLRCLQNDFARVCCALKLILLQSQEDRPELATLLLRHQINFACGMLLVYCRLALYSWGICGVDVARLVKSFDSMRLELRSLLPAAVPMAA